MSYSSHHPEGRLRPRNFSGPGKKLLGADPSFTSSSKPDGGLKGIVIVAVILMAFIVGLGIAVRV